MYSLQKMIGLKLCLSAQLAILSLLGNLNKTHYIHEKVQLYELYHGRLKWIKGSLLNCLISCMACRSHNTVFYTMANSLFTIGNSTAAAEHCNNQTCQKDKFYSRMTVNTYPIICTIQCYIIWGIGSQQNRQISCVAC